MKVAGSFPEESRGVSDEDGAKDSALTRLAAIAQVIKVSQSDIVAKAQDLIGVYLSAPDVASILSSARASFDQEKKNAKDAGKKLRMEKPSIVWIDEFRTKDYNESKKDIGRESKLYTLIIEFVVDACVSLDKRGEEERFNKNDVERFLRFGTLLSSEDVNTSSLWRIVDPSDLVPPDVESNDIVREFLRGRQRVPVWIAKHGSIWRGDLVERILSQFDDKNFLILHGPAGHGKSVSALQSLATWIERGSAAIIANSEAALHDTKLETACRSLPKVLILLDDVRITRALPNWLNLRGTPAAVVLQTLQTRKLDSQRIFLGDDAKRVRIPAPRDATAFVDNLISFDAAFTQDREVVAELFASGLESGNYGGGLWAATWEATRGEKIDDRIGTIVSEIFNDPMRAGDQLCLAAVTFLNGIIEFGQGNPMHSRLALDTRRSTVAQFIENHPDFSLTTKEKALASLDHIGALLADELFSAGQDPHILDLADDPLIEFRSASVTHAFYRWLFGAFRGDGDFHISRWPFYSALAKTLVLRRAGPADFVGALRSLLDAWRMKPQLWNRYDHGRSQADVVELAREIYDASPHRVIAAKCRMDAALAKALLFAARGATVPEEKKKELRSDAEVRLLAATVDDAPWDVLLDAANLVLTNDLRLPDDSDALAVDGLIERVLKSNADPSAKEDARYFRFKWTCLYQQDASFSGAWTKISDANKTRLSRDKKLLNILHGYLDIISNPVNNSKEASQDFFNIVSERGLSSMVSVYKFAILNLSNDAEFMKILSEAVGEGGGYAHSPGHPLVAGLRRIIRATRRSSVPFREAFGEELTSLCDDAFQQVQADDYSGLPKWLMESAKIVRSQGASRDGADRAPANN